MLDVIRLDLGCAIMMLDQSTLPSRTVSQASRSSAFWLVSKSWQMLFQSGMPEQSCCVTLRSIAMRLKSALQEQWQVQDFQHMLWHRLWFQHKFK
jgi:hypothetical protein